MLLNIVKTTTDKFVHHQNGDYICTTFTLKQINHAVAEDFEILPHLKKTPDCQISSAAAASGGARGRDYCCYRSQKESRIG